MKKITKKSNRSAFRLATLLKCGHNHSLTKVLSQNLQNVNTFYKNKKRAECHIPPQLRTPI